MSLDAMKQALEALEMYLRLDATEEFILFEQVTVPEAITALRAAIEEQETVTYDTGGFELEARFYSAAELREMIKALDEMNASARRMMGEI